MISVAGELIRATTDAEDPTCGWLISHLTSNNNTSEDPELGAISRILTTALIPALLQMALPIPGCDGCRACRTPSSLMWTTKVHFGSQWPCGWKAGQHYLPIITW